MDEIAYRLFQQRAKKADELYVLLRELYGNELPNDRLYAKARLNGVITAEERCLLQEFRRNF